MPNIVYFQIPADDVDRAKRFYRSLLGWTIEPTTAGLEPEAAAAMQYQDVSTGEAQEGTLNSGGMYKRQMSELIMNHVAVEDIDAVLANVERLGGKIIMPKMEIQSVGLNAIIQDTEGNTIGLLQWEKK
jgi:predicted enzyme related to lactoylglutathione lyase